MFIIPSINSKNALYCLFLAVKVNSRSIISLFIIKLYLTLIYSIFTSILGKISSTVSISSTWLLVLGTVSLEAGRVK